MKALITTGGMGKRMQFHGKTNKCLLKVGDKSILEHSINALNSKDIKDITVITGFCAEDVRKEIGNRVTYVHHERYQETGLIASIFLAREALENSDFILIMGDLLYDAEMLSRAVSAEGDIVVTYERKEEYVPEDSKAIVEAGLITFMGKDIPPQDTSGEFGHMVKITAAGSKILFNEIESFLGEGKGSVYLMDVINQIISRGNDVQALDITGILRIEIDFIEDLEAAREMFLPTSKVTV